MVSGWNGGASFMSAFSIQKAIDHFDTEQMKKWCSRLYHKSGIFKYIYPFLNEMPVGAVGAKQTYPQIYGLKVSLKAHRNYFIDVYKRQVLTPRNEARDVTLHFSLYNKTQAGWMKQYFAFVNFLKQGKDGDVYKRQQ